MKKLTPNKVNETTRPECRTGMAASPPAPETGSPEPGTLNRPNEPFISKNELARRLRVGVRTIERWQHYGIIPYIKCGRFVYFNWPAIVAYLGNQSQVCPLPAERLFRIPVIAMRADPKPKGGQ